MGERQAHTSGAAGTVIEKAVGRRRQLPMPVGGEQAAQDLGEPRAYGGVPASGLSPEFRSAIGGVGLARRSSGDHRQMA